MSHKPTIQYQSSGKAPNGAPFLTVKQARSYYEYAERAGQDSIFFILYDESSDKPFALINESKPPLDERLDRLAMLTTAFGGSVDSDLTPVEITQIEVLEEAGYDVPLTKILHVGTTLVSSQSSQLAHGFVVDVTGIEKTALTEFEKPGASPEFARNSVVWLTADQLVNNSDWKSMFIYTKLTTNGA